MKARAWLVVGAGLAVSGCLSGQTGSADCVPTPLACPCEYFAGQFLMKARVLEIDADPQHPSLTLEIEQILTPNERFGTTDEHRILVSDFFQLSKPCDVTERAAPEVGDTVLTVSWQPVRQGEMLYDTPTLLPYGDVIESGNGTAVPLSEVIELTNPDKCNARFPPPPHAPCNDSQFGCSIAPSSNKQRSSSQAPWALAGLLAGAALRSRVNARLARRRSARRAALRGRARSKLRARSSSHSPRLRRTTAVCGSLGWRAKNCSANRAAAADLPAADSVSMATASASALSTLLGKSWW